MVKIGVHLNKMVNGFRYYRALGSVGIASALSTALTRAGLTIRHGTHVPRAPAGKGPPNDMRPKF